MSHYHLGIILPAGMLIQSVHGYIKQVLAPYDERVEVAPYKQRVDAQVLQAGREHYGLPPGAPDTELLPRLKDWVGLEGDMDADGIYVWTRYNPKARWDWYEEGGRWCGVVTGTECPGGSHDPEAMGRYHIRANMSLIRKLKPGQGFHALLTPDGEWHEHGRMGWFGVVMDPVPDKDWDAVRAEVLSAYPSHILVSIDAHI